MESIVRRPEYVPIETAGVGDTIRCTFMDGDIETTNTGTVAHVRRLGTKRVYESEQGRVIAEFNINDTRSVSCEMVKRYEPLQPGLFEVGV